VEKKELVIPCSGNRIKFPSQKEPILWISISAENLKDRFYPQILDKYKFLADYYGH
jgi:hypothetical protein